MVRPRLPHLLLGRSRQACLDILGHIFFAYDGSRHVAAGRQKLSCGNTFVTFVVAAVVVALPFLSAPPTVTE